MSEAMPESNSGRLLRIARQVGRESEAAGMGVYETLSAKLHAVAKADDGGFLAYLQRLVAQKNAKKAQERAEKEKEQQLKDDQEKAEKRREMANAEAPHPPIINDPEISDPQFGADSAMCNKPIDITEIMWQVSSGIFGDSCKK